MDARTRLPHFFGMILIVVSLILSISLAYARLPTGIGLVPNRTPISLSPGETGSYPVTIHNGQGTSVPVTFQATVVSSPQGSTGHDLSLTFPNTVLAKPGNTRVSVEVTASGDAAPGSYLIESSILF